MANVRKNIQVLLLGTGVVLIFVSLLMLSLEPAAGQPRQTNDTTAATVTPPPPALECLFSLMKTIDNTLINFCYDRKENEKLTLYCNGTTITWARDKIRSVRKFLKRVFESLEPLETKGGYHFELVPYMNLRFNRGLLQYGIIEQKCNVTAYTIYTMYHWLCF